MVISHIGGVQPIMTNLTNKRKIILDTDIGDDIDDSFALLTMLESHAFDVLGVTTVFRNAKKRALMAKQLIRTLGYDVEVYPGCNDPLISQIKDLVPQEIRNKETVDEEGLYLIPQWEESMREETISDIHAVDFIINQVHKYPHEVTIVLVGPYTNMAVAMRKDPTIIPLIKEIRIMGGGYGLDWAEWNAFCDPEAAYIVFHSGTPLYMVGFNVTCQTGLSDEMIQKLKSSDSSAIKLVYKAMQKWFKHYEFTVPVMHDPLTIASLLDESILVFEEKKMEIDLKNTRGKTIVDENSGVLTHVATSVNKEKFFEIFNKTLKV